ncbi:hypothetical protein HNQ91_003072 [Filimonas zeae]|uniref:Uncharacterized protein n=1 Tax=Filimonas zeae TaxID=1737353 RepID=A0A917J1Z2_9BACT|nr:hypothetical protein [Filimonas zeae]MDR6340007.1 hypothetical protein [Filimonas zeae]GGH70701.1 hypothetical protein GCM10011379_29250 [Filimonas zeae]
MLSLLALPAFSTAQNLTGIWKGYFVQGFGALKQQYKYEVQIKEEPDKALKGVTYSYKDVTFYGKASLQGIFMDKTANVLIRENKMLEVKTLDGSGACAMTCYLTWRKEGKEEFLEGTYTSESVADKSPCGSGKVYLKRSPESDFYKEDFLVNGKQNAKPGMKIKPGAEANLMPNDNARLQNSSKKTTPPVTPKKPVDSALVIVPRNKTTDSLKVQPPVVMAPPVRQVPVPPILKQRESKTEKTLLVHSPEITVKLYDNGEIDNDTVTVYHNNEAVLFKKRLAYEPLVVNIHATPQDRVHELVMVADNLGTVPPNTALMVITCGDKRYELSLSSDLKKNAKIVIQYEP